MPHPANEAKLEHWCEGRRRAYMQDPDMWNLYDGHIVLTLAVYANHLRDAGGGFPFLDWRLVKAQIWVESGATDSHWYTAPMQIGVNDDPGLNNLLTSPHGKLIMPPQFAMALRGGGVAQVGRLNIIAGIGYMLRRLANFGQVRSYTSDPFTAFGGPRRTSTGLPSSPWRPSLPDFMNRPHVSAEPRQHATYSLGITGWKPFSFAYLAGPGYNGGGDGYYSGKLKFCYDLVRQPASVLAGK